MKSSFGGLRFLGDYGHMQSLRLFVVISFFIHLSFFSLVFLFPRRDDHHLLPSSYVVNLVDPELPSSSPSTVNKDTVSKAPMRESKSAEKKSENPKGSVREEELISEKIEAIKAKKRIEQIATLRNTISLHRGGEKKEGREDKITGRGGGKSLMDDYYSKITSEIWQHWIYPDMGKKDIETIIVIRILKDGSVQIKGIEKSSGNSLFDRSALRAITKASPLTPPPYEMEIGVRFYP